MSAKRLHDSRQSSNAAFFQRRSGAPLRSGAADRPSEGTTYWLIMGKSWKDRGKTRAKQPIILDE